ncbi:MAG: metalloregulator ArsR/SmtB family transcription factor [Nanoarchaeota archaeon]
MIDKNILKLEHNHDHTKISEKELYEVYKIFFGTLVSELRLKIINLLKKDKKTVSEIMNELCIDQTAVSHNLARLKLCGFVKSEIDGKFRKYYLNKETIKPLIDIINKHMSQYCIHILRKMKKMKGGEN